MDTEPILGDIVAAVDQAVIATDLNGEILFWSKSAELLYGWTEAEVLGRNILEVTPSPESREAGAEIMDALIRGERWSGEFTVQRRDGSYFPAFVTNSPILNSEGDLFGVVGVSFDITQQKEREKERTQLLAALQEMSERSELERTRLYQLLMNAPAFICVLKGPDHVYEMANPLYVELASRKELIGRPVREIFPELEAQGYVALLENVFRTGEPFAGSEMPLTILPDPGEPRVHFINLAYQPIIENGEIVGIFCHAVDVTAHVEARHRADALLEEVRMFNRTLERRVADRTAELIHANHQLQLRNRELQEFAFAASHDLKEPLRKVATFIDLFLQDYGEDLDVSGMNLLSRAQRGALRMNELVESLLTYSRVATRLEEYESIKLNSVVSDVLSEVYPTLQKTGATVAIGNLPTITADPVEMRQLFRNLISNALKFQKDGAIPEIRIDKLEEFCDDKVVALEISDNGVGFEEAHAERIFSPFKRLHGRSEFEGAGMGLAICRRIVERHGGALTARSRPGEGSTFKLVLHCRPIGLDGARA